MAQRAFIMRCVSNKSEGERQLARKADNKNLPLARNSWHVKRRQQAFVAVTHDGRTGKQHVFLRLLHALVKTNGEKRQPYFICQSVHCRLVTCDYKSN